MVAKEEKDEDSGNECPGKPCTPSQINRTGICSIRGKRMEVLKGKWAIKVFDKHLELGERYWGMG